MGGTAACAWGSQRCPLRAPPLLCWAFLGCPVLPPPHSASPSASSACCLPCPPGLGDPPGPPGWVPLPWGHCLAMVGGVLSPLTAASIARGAAGTLQSPPRLPGGPTECWGPVGEPPLTFPLGTSRSCWRELWGDPQNSGHVLLPSRAQPCCPGCVLQCPSSFGGPQPSGVPIPWGSLSRGDPQPSGGRRARAGPSNADFVSLSPL